jgi:hypothetical protein
VAVAGVQVAAEAAGDLVHGPVAELMAADGGRGLQVLQQLAVAGDGLRSSTGPYRPDSGAPRCGAGRHPRHHRGPGGRAGAAVSDNVADRRERRHRTGDVIQVLPGRRSDPVRLARTSDHRSPCTAQGAPRSARRPRTAAGSSARGLRVHLPRPLLTRSPAPNSPRSCIGVCISPERCSMSTT